jgi:hypothetical protein
MKQIFKVVSQSETITIPSQKTESGQSFKSTIVLQEIGGKFADAYAATMLGNTAKIRFNTGDIVVAALRFAVHEHNDQVYQDVVVDDIVKLN